MVKHSPQIYVFVRLRSSPGLFVCELMESLDQNRGIIIKLYK